MLKIINNAYCHWIEEINMYFNEIVTNLSAFPQSIIDGMLAQSGSIIIEKDSRKYFGLNTTGVISANMSLRLKGAIVPALDYIKEQEYSCLKGMTAYQIGICNIQPGWPGFIQYPTKFLYTISEQIVIPLMSDATVTLANKNRIIESGNVYRFNNRVESTIIASPDFLALVIIYLDSDVYGHVPDVMMNTLWPRQKHEVIIR